MENYYFPFYLELNDSTEFSIQWQDNGSYNFINSCPSRVGDTMAFFEINSWGFLVNKKTDTLPATAQVLVGEGCDFDFDYDIATVSSSRSLLDSPNFAPFLPFYFFLLLGFSLYLFGFCFRLFFGSTRR